MRLHDINTFDPDKPSALQTAAPFALDNAHRLSMLARTELMDSLPEPSFDRITALASRLLGTPVNLVSLVDDHRQYFKAQCGLPAPYDSTRQTPLSHSFCQHVVTADAPLIVTDARTDARVSDNGAIEDLSVIAYLGVPIHAPDGQPLGSFCAIESVPRIWSRDDVKTLEDLAASLESEIALRLTLAEQLAEREMFALILDELPVGLSLASAPGGQHYFSNIVARAMLTDDDDTVVLGEDHPLARTARDGVTLRAESLVHPAGADPDHPETTHLEIDTRRLSSHMTFAVGVLRDVTDRKRSDAARERLTSELDHRVKNLFAVVSGMVGATARSAESPAAMADTLRGRIGALAKAHALVRPALAGPDHRFGEDVGARVDNGSLRDIVDAIIAPHVTDADTRPKIEGPLQPLRADAAAQLSLILHELATNAAKYGSLSQPGGTLSVSWQVIGDRLRLVWDEHHRDLQIDAHDKRPQGLGTRLIAATVRSQFAGTHDAQWRPTGLFHQFDLALDRLN